MLDLSKLENVRQRSGKVEARCPACAQMGADTSGNHLYIGVDGRFGCIVNQGPDGEAHRKEVWRLTGSADAAQPKPIPAKRKAARVMAPLPALRPLTAKEMAGIQHLRGWHTFAGLELLTQRGLLHFARVWDDGADHPAWLVTDSTGRNAQARKLDGTAWKCGKAKTLPGREASWPIGAPEIGNRRNVALCEGQPDFAAALLVAWWEGVEVAPVCMTGAGNSIPADALPYFTGKRVRIAVHSDEAGLGAGKRWARQLRSVGAVVDGFDFSGLSRADGKPVEDLADYATLLDSETPATAAIFAGLHDSTPRAVV